MKKFLLSCLVAIAFIGYSFHQRSEDSRALTSSNPTKTTPPRAAFNSTALNTAPTGYKDGQYTGSVADAFYGNVQVKVTIQTGQIVDVQFLQYPHDNSTSQAINNQAIPYLKQEAIQAQSAHVNVISGATDTSLAFMQSLSAALSHAA